MTEDELRRIVRDELSTLLTAVLEGLNDAGPIPESLTVAFLEGLLEDAA